MIPLTKPWITPELKQKVCEVLDSGFLTEGKVVSEFEETFKKYIGCQEAIAVTSCTVGLEVALRALKVGPGDEVIVPDYTYPATADVVAIVGAKAVLVDINAETLNIDYDQLEQSITSKTKTIIPVSLFGNPLDWKRLNQIKQKHGISIIEDAACSVGAEFDGLKVGNLADITVFSFHPRKMITTGEGGMITTNHSKLAQWMRAYKKFGIQIGKDSKLDFQSIGTNYKMSDILAAMGLYQLIKIDFLLKQRRELAHYYIHRFSSIKGIDIPKTTFLGKHSYQSFCILVNHRDEWMQRMKTKGIETQIGTYALHRFKPFQTSKTCRIFGKMKNSRYAYDHCLTLPLYPGLTRRDQERITLELDRNLKTVSKD